MNREKRERIKQAAETFAEKVLARVMALPAPWTAVVTFGVPVALFVIGFLVGRP